MEPSFLKRVLKKVAKNPFLFWYPRFRLWSEVWLGKRVILFFHGLGQQSNEAKVVELQWEDFSNAEILATNPWDRTLVEKRFKVGHRLFAVEAEGTLVSFIWVLESSEFFLEELNRVAVVDKNTVWLYDGNTPLSYRGKGYYKQLLRYLGLRFHPHAVIYAREDNLPSIRGIEGAGFVAWAKVKKLPWGIKNTPIKEATKPLHVERQKVA